MDELKNLTQEEVLEIVKTCNVQPLYNNIIITTNTAEMEDDDIEDITPTFDAVQYVVAVGSHVREVSPGDKVLLDISKMMSKNSSSNDAYSTVTSLQIKPVEIGDHVFAIIDDRKIDLVYKL